MEDVHVGRRQPDASPRGTVPLISTPFPPPVSKTGGHLGSSLGVVELTVALHHVFNAPEDKIIWDVGHQAYGHKILTGRRDRMRSIRQNGGLSGFTKREESEYDPFGAGHSSTSISAGLGMAVGRDFKGKRNNVIAVIGDGAITGGMAYEAMNHAGFLDKNMIVVLNDNQQVSLPTHYNDQTQPPVGALSSAFARLQSNKPLRELREIAKAATKQLPQPMQQATAKIDEYARGMISGSQSTLFEELGLYYIGPVDGEPEHAPAPRPPPLAGHAVDPTVACCLRRFAHLFSPGSRAGSPYLATPADTRVLPLSARRQATMSRSWSASSRRSRPRRPPAPSSCTSSPRRGAGETKPLLPPPPPPPPVSPPPAASQPVDGGWFLLVHALDRPRAPLVQVHAGRDGQRQDARCCQVRPQDGQAGQGPRWHQGLHHLLRRVADRRGQEGRPGHRHPRSDGRGHR